MRSFKLRYLEISFQANMGNKDFHEVPQSSYHYLHDKLKINFQDEPKEEISQTHMC